MIMPNYKCNDCGTHFDATRDCCPNCGCPKSDCTPLNETQNTTTSATSEPISSTTSFVNNVSQKRDWAHYIYECGVLFWDTYRNRFACFTGRASRRELWSFIILFWFVPGLSVILCFTPFFVIYFLASFIPFVGVWVRRMHDINKSGWWSICPVASFFLSLKKSDEGANNYGKPMDYSHILS